MVYNYYFVASFFKIVGGKDAYFPLQAAFSIVGLLWIYLFFIKVKHISELPEDAWRTHLDDEARSDTSDMMNGENNEISSIEMANGVNRTNKKAR